MIPQFLLELLENQYGEEITKKIIDGYNSKRVVTLRINEIKAKPGEVENELERNNIEWEKVSWSKTALILKHVTEKNVHDLDIYKNGKIYLQSLSSMLPPIFLEPREKADILDMAAAPGGKTTQMAAMTNNKAHITACEMNKIRAERLKFNIEKQGATSVYIMIEDVRNIDDLFLFDQILLDAPCSGSGTIDVQNSKLNKYFTLKLIEKCVKSQEILIRKAIQLLKPGKEMIYSTCSVLKAENEQIIEEILKEGKAKIVNLEPKEGIPLLPVKIKGTIGVCPNDLYEGFFIAKLRKI